MEIKDIYSNNNVSITKGTERKTGTVFDERWPTSRKTNVHSYSSGRSSPERRGRLDVN